MVTKVSKREWWFYEGFIFSVVGIGIIISGIINRDYSSLIIGMVLVLIGAFSFFVGWQKLKWFREIDKLGIKKYYQNNMSFTVEDLITFLVKNDNSKAAQKSLIEYGFPKHNGKDDKGNVTLGVEGLVQIAWNELNKRGASDYKITLTLEQAAKGLEKDLSRNGKQLRIIIPPNIKSGTRIRLPNARLNTDGIPGDIFIMVYVKKNASV